LIGAEEAERDQEHVQQAGMVRVLDVLEHQLPVAADALAHVAEHAQRTAVEDAIEERHHGRAEVRVERRRGGVERGEDYAVPLAYREALQTVVGELEVRGHAALSPQPALQWHRLESAAEVIRPLMIGTHELLHGAEILSAELQTAVRAAIGDD